MSTTQEIQGTLRGPGFDSAFIVGIPSVALLVGAVVAAKPELFLLVFTIDLWLLGYHHVAATFTRVCFDFESFRQNRSLMLVLPLVIAAGVLVVVSIAGLWPIATLYLYWQWWHYTRQSEGIQKAYAAKNRGATIGRPTLARAVHYALPIAAILTVSARQPDVFLFLPVRTLPVPMELALLAQVVAGCLTVVWLVEQFIAWTRGTLALTYSAYTVSHLVIYAVAYIGFEDATKGWLVINLWHNAQYIAFVWMFNNRRFASGIHPKHVLLSTLSQTKNWWMYLLACLTVSTALYYSAQTAFSWLVLTNAAYLAAFYQVVNFHHYVVDSKIWKLRRPAIQQTIGIA